MFKFIITVVLIVCLSNYCISDSNAEKYTILVEPIYPDYQIQEVYAPLKQWLIANTGYDIEIKADFNYHFYWLNAQGDDYPDFTLDASHIGLYRNLFKNYTPLFTTIEPTAFHLVSLEEIDKKHTVEYNFNGKSIAMIPSPSIAVELFNQWFNHKYIAPRKNVMSVSWQDTIELLFDGSVSAAIIPSKLKELYPNLVTVLKSQDMQGPTFMSSPHVPKEVVDKFKLAILLMNNNPKAFNVLTEMNTQGFMPVDQNKFQNIQNDFPNIFNKNKISIATN